MKKLDRNFFDRPTLTVSRELLGKKIVKIENDGSYYSGIINEVEAYIGETDMACHARVGLTERTKTLYDEAGTLYIYLIYGMYWMLNIVTESRGFPAAILIRSIIPTHGIDMMINNRHQSIAQLTNGPAKFTKSFNIDKSWNGYNICSKTSKIFVTSDTSVNKFLTKYNPRKGINNTPEPWRSLAWNISYHST